MTKSRLTHVLLTFYEKIDRPKIQIRWREKTSKLLKCMCVECNDPNWVSKMAMEMTLIKINLYIYSKRHTHTNSQIQLFITVYYTREKQNVNKARKIIYFKYLQYHQTQTSLYQKKLYSHKEEVKKNGRLEFIAAIDISWQNAEEKKVLRKTERKLYDERLSWKKSFSRRIHVRLRTPTRDPHFALLSMAEIRKTQVKRFSFVFRLLTYLYSNTIYMRCNHVD